MIPKRLRLVSLLVLLTFSSEQILLAYPPSVWRPFRGEESLFFSSPVESRISKAQETGILGQFSASENPYLAFSKGLVKRPLLEQAGWFKKLFKKIKKFFQKIFQPVIKLLVKIRDALQSFMKTGFGKVVGFIFGGPIILAALNVAINSFSYLAQGDIKGLFKYWAKNALQIAMIVASAALMFIPGVGQALGMALQFAGKFLSFAGSLLAGAGNLLGNLLGAVPGIGQALGNAVSGALNFAGGFLEGFGSSLVSQGRLIVQRSNEIFRNLREQNFKNVAERLKQNLGLSSRERPLPRIEINPRIPEVKLPGGKQFADYTRYFQASGGRATAHTNPLQRQIEKAITEALLVIVTGGRIDKRGESGKITNALEGILQTVVHAGIEALKQRFVNQFAPSASSSPLESAGVRAPPPNLPQIQRGRDSSSRIISPQTGNQPLFQRTSSGYAFAHNGNGTPYKYESPKSPYPQKLEHLRDDTYRNIGDEGRIDEFKRNPLTGEMKATGPSSFDQFSAKANEFFSDARQKADQFWDRTKRSFGWKPNEERFAEALRDIYSGKARYEPYPFGRSFSTPSISEAPYRITSFQDPHGFSTDYWKPVPGYPVELNKDFREIAAHFNASYVSGGDPYGAGKLAQLQYYSEVRDGMGKVLASRSLTAIRHGLTAYNATLEAAAETYRAGAGIHYVFVQRRGNEYRWWMMTYVPQNEGTRRRDFQNGRVEDEWEARRRLGIR